MLFTQGIFAAHAKQVIEDDIEGKPANTMIAYNWKAEEFIMYCQQVHPSSSSVVSNTIVTEENFLDSFSTSRINPFEKKEGKKLVLKQKYSTNLNTLNWWTIQHRRLRSPVDTVF